MRVLVDKVASHADEGTEGNDLERPGDHKGTRIKSVIPYSHVGMRSRQKAVEVV